MKQAFLFDPTFFAHLLYSRPMLVARNPKMSKTKSLYFSGSFSSAYKYRISQKWSSFENAKIANISHRQAKRMQTFML